MLVLMRTSAGSAEKGNPFGRRSAFDRSLSIPDAYGSVLESPRGLGIKQPARSPKRPGLAGCIRIGSYLIRKRHRRCRGQRVPPFALVKGLPLSRMSLLVEMDPLVSQGRFSARGCPYSLRHTNGILIRRMRQALLARGVHDFYGGARLVAFYTEHDAQRNGRGTISPPEEQKEGYRTNGECRDGPQTP